MKYERKGLDRKNRLYSMILAVVLLACLVGYFICMLPSLYVSYRKEQNLKSVTAQHRAYVETGSYDGVRLANPVACFSVKVPYEDGPILLTSQSWQLALTAETPEAEEAFLNLRRFLYQHRDGEFPEGYDGEQFEAQVESWFDGWKELPVSLPVHMEAQLADNMEYDGENVKLHRMSDDLLVVEATVRDRENIYTNYMALEDTEDAMVITCLPAMTPDMDEIRPVVLQSVPMLAAVILLLVLLFSQAYSGGILRPVYCELERQNQELLEENKRREVFMRASSHQLKTPLSAALLLLDGMINRVGKYQEAEVYLPKVREQLLSMRKMVEDILSLNQGRDSVSLQEMELRPLLEAKLREYQVAASDKRLRISCTGESLVRADEYMLRQILDNLISNAVKYTPEGNKIEATLSEAELVVENYGVTVPADLLPHIFDPFVSGSHEKDIAGHGLGLYIAAYYAKQMGFHVSIENRENSVRATLRFTISRS